MKKNRYFTFALIALAGFCFASQSAQADEVDVTSTITRFWCALDDGDGDLSEMNLVRTPANSILRVRYKASAFEDKIANLGIERVTYDSSTQVFTVTLKGKLGYAEARMLDRNRLTNRPRGTIYLYQGFFRKAYNCHVEGAWGKSS